MNQPVRRCGKTFPPELLAHLNALRAAQPRPSKAAPARTRSTARNWFSPTGRPAVASALVTLCKLEKRGPLAPGGPPRRSRRPQRLRTSGQPLPPVPHVPGQVDPCAASTSTCSPAQTTRTTASGTISSSSSIPAGPRRIHPCPSVSIRG